MLGNDFTKVGGKVPRFGGVIANDSVVGVEVLIFNVHDAFCAEE